MPAERILVVDDEDPIREVVSSMLTSANFVCSQAASGKEALALLQSGEEFELMLSDLMMAGMDGQELLGATKERFPDMPVVMVTAVHDVSVALSAIRNGAYDYLLKPFEREQLLATVRRALENRRLKLENRAYQTNLEALVTARTDQLRQAVTTLERSYDITLEALGDALDLKDAETEGHSKRVTAFTIAMARAMGLNSDQIRVIARGAFLHDIGKMAIPDAILRKPGALDPAEREIMREHCYRGYQMLRKIPFLSEAAEIVYSHQDAMTSNRPYRAAQTLAAAREEILRFSGKQFDPEVVKTFLAMPENIWDDLRKEIDSQIYRFAYTAAATAKA
jgi:putative nucleotidyltransferase with HDIG domain